MDIEQLAEQLPSTGELPGVALLVARDVIESAVIAGRLDAQAASCLRSAGHHLRQARGRNHELDQRSWIGDDLVQIAGLGKLPEEFRLKRVRDTLRDLVRAIPAEGSVSLDVEYAGF
jgi:hypothetical protein